MRLLKVVLIALSILLGVLCFYEGLGLEFRILDYDFLDKFGIPIGLALIALGALIAKLWTIPD
jgi:hypothetical protein